MRPALMLWALAVAAATAAPAPTPTPVCAPTDNPADCAALRAFATSLGRRQWAVSTGWMTDASVCKWYGVTCDGDGRVSNITMKRNMLNGTLPDAIGNLSHLVALDLSGSRPASYTGCTDSDVGRTGIPPSLYGLSRLSVLRFEYMCLGGELSPMIGQLTELTELSIHGNYVGGVLPPELNRLTKMTRLKLGRNPISGPFPDVRALTSLSTFACNFANLSGPIPDIFDSFPNLEITFWDGNALEGPLPKSIRRLTRLHSLSFNINRLSGPVPSEWSALASSGVLTDCRIGIQGSDTNLTAYQANYPWVPKTTGNLYTCPLPSFATGHGVCNHILNCHDVTGPCSPVKCK